MAAAATAAARAAAPPPRPPRRGNIGSFSGPQAASLGAADETIKAWESYTKANGGIDDHPVKVIVVDDGASPAKAAQLVKQLVEPDKVQAIVGSTSTVTQSFQKYILANGEEGRREEGRRAPVRRGRGLLPRRATSRVSSTCRRPPASRGRTSRAWRASSRRSPTPSSRTRRSRR